MAGKSDVTTANVSSLNKPLENSFDKTAVEAQLGAQVQVSQAFDTERRSYRLEMAREEEKLRKEAEEARKQGNIAIYDAKIKEADKQQEKMVLFDSITGAIYGPNTNGVTGYVARAVAPEVSYQIGQYFKGNDFLNGLDGGNRNGEGSAPHILAHGILAAAVSAATGNDPTTGALSAMGVEAGAKYVANYLFPDTKLSELTAEQKATVSSIMSLAGLGMGATTGDVGSAVSAGEVAQVAVDDNGFNKYAKESEATKQWKAQNRAFVVNQINGILEYKPFDLVYKVAANGDTIVCIPIGSYTCGLRLGEHFASPEEVRKGNSEFLMSVVPIPGVGGGAKVIAKETGQVIGIYKDAKAANAAIQRARVEANIATSKAARATSNFPTGKANNLYKVLKNSEVPPFTVNNKQLGKKLGSHVGDFGGNLANPADREKVKNIINDIGSNPEKVISGDFAGQGANGARGPVHFRIKGNDVVVTKPNGEFVTILKNGITNTSVKTALKGVK